MKLASDPATFCSYTLHCQMLTGISVWPPFRAGFQPHGFQDVFLNTCPESLFIGKGRTLSSMNPDASTKDIKSKHLCCFDACTLLSAPAPE